MRPAWNDGITHCITSHCPNPPAPGRRQCQRCLDRQKGYYRTRRATLIAMGKCPLCGKEPPAKDRKYCLYCLGKAAEANALAYPRRAERAREYARQKRQQHKELGLCHCGRPRAPGRRSCPACLKRRVRQIARKRMERIRKGVCQLCGREPLLPGLKIGSCCQKRTPNPRPTAHPMPLNHPWRLQYRRAIKEWKFRHGLPLDNLPPATSRRDITPQEITHAYPQPPK